MDQQVAKLSKLVERYELIANRMEAIAAHKPELPPKPATLASGRLAHAPAQSTEVPPHVRDYDDALGSALAAFTEKSAKIGGDCQKASALFAETFGVMRAFLWKAAGQAEPSPSALPPMLEPIQAKIKALTDLRDASRKSPHFNHLSGLSEAVAAVGWVAVKPTPAPHVKEMGDAAKFYTNRVRKDHKETAPEHVEWVTSLEAIINDLYTFVRKTHTTGLVWNSSPGAAPPAANGPPAPARAGGPPPPPPPPPPADFFKESPAEAKEKAGRTELFAQLNQGEGITSSLRKVTADMQTHKNPNLRATNTVPSGATSAAKKTGTVAPVQAVQKPPKKELVNGKQWTVEYYKNDSNITIDVSDKKETIYIFKCENCTIRVAGKCNSITLDQCKKVGIACDAVVAQLETINCQSLGIQTFGELPTISIQKTDGCQIYLSELSKNAEIVTSKSSEMNVLVPEGEGGEFIEMPLPEQFKTVYRNGKLETTVSDIC